MSTNILPFQKKLRLAFFSFIVSGALIYSSQNYDLNEKAQRILVKFLNVPQQFISQVLSEYREFENQKIAQLEEEILNLRNQIYENELEIKSLENSRPYNNLDIGLRGNFETVISSFDQINFTCCNKHRVYINNPNNLENDIYAISQGNFAWLIDREEEASLIKTMKKASRLSILAKANNGRQTKDLYSMMGFTKAYNTARKSCA